MHSVSFKDDIVQAGFHLNGHVYLILICRDLSGVFSASEVRDSEDFYNLSKDKLLELILSDELEIEDEQVRDLASSFLHSFPPFFPPSLNKMTNVQKACKPSRLCVRM